MIASVFAAASITYSAQTFGEVDGSVFYLNGDAPPHPFTPAEIQAMTAAGTEAMVGAVDGKAAVF